MIRGACGSVTAPLRIEATVATVLFMLRAASTELFGSIL
jgi:hypothetical protein